MADEVDWLDLPGRWTYGVDRGGRVFFINDEEKSTRWVHPGTKSPIQSGHCSSPDLPKGWEMDFTQEGAVYFIKLRGHSTHRELPWTLEELSVLLCDFIQSSQQLYEGDAIILL
ncbi:pleckstrin homology domain-containing family A member 7-like [Rousettus aegyptiacus]|uniref:pleckstrin homology domain-containing family A member 7-like n=1 Tax=Rousettus aegyptiacus TaxID=9407 RepID=UPI00168D0259|nr:pleckstrin homology domain-containing family A member 7-like [Rousettus aegyptiacus]